MTIPSATQHTYPDQNEPIWSKSEKLIARTAFDAALGRELHEVIQEVNEDGQPDPAIVGSVGLGKLPDPTS